MHELAMRAWVTVAAQVSLLLLLMMMSLHVGRRGIRVSMARGLLHQLFNLMVQASPLSILVIEGIYGFIIPGDCSSVDLCAKYGWHIHKAMLILTALAAWFPVRCFVIRYLLELHRHTHSAEQDVVLVTKRTRFVVSDYEKELRSGALEFKKKKKTERDNVLPEDHEDSKRVHRIATKIVKAAKEIMPGTHVLLNEWEVIVIGDDKKIEASCLPGCKISVYTGLLKTLEKDAELATVLSHEISHAIARHTAEECTRSFLELGILRFCERFAPFFLMPRSAAAFVIRIWHNFCVMLPLSRRMEVEADRIGLSLLASAGYDPSVASSVYRKLGEVKRDARWRFNSTHPSFEKRARLVELLCSDTRH